MSIISALIGGVLAMLGGFMSEGFRTKRDKSKWIRDNSASLYFELITLLESISIALTVEQTDHFDENAVIADTETFNDRLEHLSSFMDNNAGRIIVFVPNEIYKELMYLKRELYQCSQEKEFEMQDLYGSVHYKTVLHAKTIAHNLKDTLLQ